MPLSLRRSPTRRMRPACAELAPGNGKPSHALYYRYTLSCSPVWMQTLFIGRALVHTYPRLPDGIVTNILRLRRKDTQKRGAWTRDGDSAGVTRPLDSASALAPAWGEAPAQPSWLAAPVR
jgi:hypothetical protein